MAKAKSKKELSPEERLKIERERCIKAFDGTENYELRHAPEPTYRFNVGDAVRYGAMQKSVVESVFSDGKGYLLRCMVNNQYETYRSVIWHQIRPIAEDANTNFAKNQEIKLYFNNTTVESILHKYYFFGVDMNPEYQRGFVWDDKDRENLIRSIFENIDIGKFVFVQLDGNEWLERDVGYEILDGKQRLSTIAAFYENRFAYHGKYFNDLSPEDRRVFLGHMVAEANIRDASKKEIYNYFVMLNRTGKAMDEAQIAKVEAMIDGK